MKIPMERMFENLKETLGDKHVRDVSVIMDLLKPYHEAREAEYDRSFAKRGLIGIWHNLGRKFDAIDNLGMKGELTTRVAVDHIVDLALYSLKFLDAISKIPGGNHAWSMWLKEIYGPATGMTLPNIDDIIANLRDTYDTE